MSDEQVLVFSAAKLEPYLPLFHNSVIKDRPTVGKMMTELVYDQDSIFFLERPLAEANPDYKQVIPYCVLKRGDELFIYQRTKKGGESRLHENWSLGVGGHINPIDGDDMDIYQAALRRELFEEVGFSLNGASPACGLLYDPSNEVGRVHFGIVHVIEIPSGATLRFEDPALAGGKFVKKQDLMAEGRQFENWSQIIIDNLI